ncbi:MAG: acyl-CoA dehydrogenase family protein [Pseudomonadales bacterium]|nr:acyl-CoA dehydrogenase family protein [Pseudomonadales bacterium]
MSGGAASGDGRKDTPEQAEFRDYCQDWLSNNLPSPPTVRLPQSPLEIMTTDQLEYLCAWQKSAYDAGLVGCDYPEAHGGAGRKDCQRIANQEMQSVASPYLPNVIGLGMAAPTIYFHAQEPLKERVLPKLLSGEEIWCQGFSEPGAGSDLASVQTFAKKDGDNWIINGHKVWTSLAHFATWMIILVRTDKSDKYKGLSYFVVPIKEALGKGVTVRPLIKITGETGFNEVIFEDLVIPDAWRLGEVGEGWQVAMTTLTHERGAGPLVTPASGGKDKSSSRRSGSYGLIDLAKECNKGGRPASEDPIVRDKVMQTIIRQEGLRQAVRMSRVPSLVDHPMRIPLQGKLVGTEIMQDVAALAMEIEGAASSLYLADENAPHEGQWPLAYMNSFGMTIAAGTSEVQRNILGERVLGLPKSK